MSIESAAKNAAWTRCYNDANWCILGIVAEAGTAEKRESWWRHGTGYRLLTPVLVKDEVVAINPLPIAAFCYNFVEPVVAEPDPETFKRLLRSVQIRLVCDIEVDINNAIVECPDGSIRTNETGMFRDHAAVVQFFNVHQVQHHMHKQLIAQS
jgi:hypothetical protein